MSNSNKEKLIDTSVSKLSDRLGTTETQVRNELNEWDGPSAFAGKVTLTPTDLATLAEAL